MPKFESGTETHGRIAERVTDDFLDGIATSLSIGAPVAVARHSADGQLDPQPAVPVVCWQAFRREPDRLPRPARVNVEQPVRQRGVAHIIQVDSVLVVHPAADLAVPLDVVASLAFLSL